MARVILHIGTHKTATTTIQDCFRQNAALLADHGLIYPTPDPRHAGHHGLVMDWNPLPAVYALPQGATAALRAIAAAHAGGSDTVFLSSEEFSRGAEGARVDFAAVRAALRGFDRIEVLCLLREQWRFLQSIYVEVSKYKPPPRPALLAQEALATGMAEGLWLDYTRLYDHLLTAFAPDEITFLDFDAAARGPGGVLGAVLRHLGLPLKPAALAVAGGGRANVSAPPLAVWGASLVAEPAPPPDWLVSAMAGGFEAETGQPALQGCLWTRAELAQLSDFATRCNRQLCARRTALQPGLRLGSTCPPAGAIHREDLASGFWLRGARWIFAAREPPRAGLPAAA